MPAKIRENVLRMEPYSPGKPIEEVQRELGLSEVVKLASNENPLGPSPRAIEAIRQASTRIHIYPDAATHELRLAIARHHGLSPNQIAVGNGSDELIHLLGLVFLGHASRLICGKPSFVRYAAAAHLSDCELLEVPLTDDWQHDLVRMREAIDEETGLVFVANPNNPTGSVTSPDSLQSFIQDIEGRATAVVDEAYAEYAVSSPDFRSCIDLVRQGHGLVVLRTFSKAYGLAGLRLGYALAPEEIVDAINRAREPFNANALAQAAGIAALSDTEFLERSRQLNTEGLRRVSDFCHRHGLPVIPSLANFACINLGTDAHQAFEELLRRGVIVRSGRPLGMPTYIRVSIGKPDELTRFFCALEEVLA